MRSRDITGLTDSELEESMAELQKEKARREAEVERIREEGRQARLAAIHEGLTRELVDALVPEHDRTTCDDVTRQNGNVWSDEPPRCTRCVVLEFLDYQANGYSPPLERPWVFVLKIEEA